MISIIIPMYNVEKYIIPCLESFENQRYKYFEIIVVDDGSKDNSAKLVAEYIEKSNMNIKLFLQDNSGVSSARNKGIHHAIGEYLCFVDSDDMIAPGYLNEMFNAMNKYNFDLVFCGVKTVTEESKINSIVNKQQKIEDMENSEALKKFLFRDISPGVWSLMVRADVIKKNNLFFAEGYRYSEDIEFIYKILVHSRRVGNINNALYLYRIRNTSVMSLVDDKRLDGFKLMQNLEKYFDIEAPEFSKKFRSYGVARWVWATLWQSALASKSYNEFEIMFNRYKAKIYIRKLLAFPRLNVFISSLLFVISPYLYYKVARKFGVKKLRERTLTN